MQPFSMRTLSVAAILLVSGAVAFLIPQLSLIPDILCRSSAFSLVFGVLIIGLRISEDVDALKRKVLDKFYT